MKETLSPTAATRLGRFLSLALLLFACPLAPHDVRCARAEDDVIDVESSAALIHLGSLDSFDVTERGKSAARQILQFLEKGDRLAARDAIDIYRKIIPDENFGGEYGALQWLLECEISPEAERKKRFLSDPLVESFRDFLAKDDFAALRSFLREKYHIDEKPNEFDAETKHRNRFLEDFILFANPRREEWEKSSKMIEALGLRPGDRVADVGSGPGYFSFQFARLVGDGGRVYAIDNADAHIAYLKETIARLGVKNVTPIMPEIGSISVPEKVDLVYICSLYHNLYAMATDEERASFVGSIRQGLKEGGRLVIADNGPVADTTLPYHGPYIRRELIIAQLRHHGFDLVETRQFIPQRYMLFFKLRPGFAGLTSPAPVPPLPPEGITARSLRELRPTHLVASLEDGAPDRIRILSERSLLYAPVPDAAPIFSEAGREAARHFLEALRSGNPAQLRAARDAYGGLLPVERFGDEYSAFQWFCDYLLAPQGERAGFLRDPATAEYCEFFAGNECERLKTYLREKYLLEDLGAAIDGAKAEGKMAQGPAVIQLLRGAKMKLDKRAMAVWWEYMAFGNPTRDTWERTDKTLDFLALRPGETVADVGCGPGHYSLLMARRVGERGKIYALEMVQEHLTILQRTAARAGIKNIETVVSKENDVCLPEGSIDTAFLCSLYHACYAYSMEYVRQGFIDSLKKALRPKGRLVIVDNQPLSLKENPYYGRLIAKELIIAQLHHYGFKFAGYAQFVPQRYVLVFEKP